MTGTRFAAAPVDPGNPVDGSDAQRVARDELSRSGYRHDGANWLDRVGDWIARLLGHLFDGHGPGGALLVFVILLVIVLGLIVVRAGLPRRTPRSPNADDTDPLAPDGARDHRRRADRFAADGEHALALREYLRAAVATIEDRGVLPPRPGRTGAATAREAGPLLPNAAPALVAATAAFDQVWFGGRAATVADVEHARAAADTVAAGRVGAGSTTHDAPAGLAVPE